VTHSLLPILAVLGSAALAAAAGLRMLLRAPPASWLAENYRGATVVGRGGTSLGAALVAGAIAAALLQRALGTDPTHLYATIVATGIFGLLGWIDDSRGSPGVRGLKGHLAHLVKHRRATTGAIKAVGGSVVALWAGYLLGAAGWAVLPAGAVIALFANSVNALDTRPGRAGKAFVALAALLVAASLGRPVSGPLVGLWALLGGALVFLPADLSERAMLGDTGANALGCALGLAVIAVAGWPVWVALSVLLFLFCLAADRWSLTQAIESSAVLRWLDELGRPRTPCVWENDGN
jgi:UDP-GlcNAc:undecaprenyl-phosphate GlcNAc-1-phosphate transferase